MSIESEEMSDEDKNYLLAIEKQKLKREELIRQKDLKRARENEVILAVYTFQNLHQLTNCIIALKGLGIPRMT